MLNGLSDSSLNSWSSWLQLVGFAGIICVAASLVGNYFVNGQLMVRANRKAADGTHLAALAVAQAAATEAREETTQRKLSDVLTAETPRQLTETQKHDFVADLKDAPKGQVEVFIYDYRDTEIQGYANQIRDLLMAAGYDCGEKVQVSTKPFSPEGLFVVVNDPRTAPPDAVAIQHAFGAIGLDAPAARDANLDADRVVVIVGRKFK